MDASSPSTPGEPLRHQGFRVFWSTGTLTFLGASVTMVAADALIITELEATESQVGLVRAVQFLPYPLIGLLVGALVDRWRKKPTLIWSTLGSGLALALIPLLGWAGHLSLLMVAAALFLASGLGVFTVAAQQSILPDLVRREELVIANARLGQSMTVAQTSGPPLGGALVGLIGGSSSILAGGVSNLVAAAFLLRVRVSEPPRRRVGGSIWSDVAVGVRYVYRHRTLAPLAVSTHLWFLANSAAVTVFALFALRELGLSALLYGFALAMAGIAGLGGAFAAPWIGRRLGEGNAVILARMLCAPAWIIVVLAPGSAGEAFLALCAGQAIHGFSMGLDDPNEGGYRQAVTPRQLLGRMSTTMRTVNRTMAVLGALLGGVIAGALGYTAALWGIITVFVLAAVLLALSPFRGARA
ncbi:MFS transporter [Brachybacterium sp.]|uniref:MFS transporter n=1 Tax=Brachybacterium sp. TaxID=1891286 RepID=UPI002ED255F4